MLNFFGLPIIISFFLGYFFPYTALALSPYAFLVLFFLMMTSFLDFRWIVLKKLSSYKIELLTGLFFLFLFFPLLQWFLSRYLIQEYSLFYGAIWASLCPIAIVAPHFTRLHRADEDLALLFLLASMVIFPFVVLFSLPLLKKTVHIGPIVLDMLILIFLPMVLTELIKVIDQKFLGNKVVSNWRKIVGEINMLSIAFLTFIYLGSSVTKLNLSYTSWSVILGVVSVVLFQDFGVYFISKFLLEKIFVFERSRALVIGISAKNLAISGTILLFYDPKASLASAIGFFAHALFFNYLVLSAKD